jgi:hypothetical protein
MKVKRANKPCRHGHAKTIHCAIHPRLKALLPLSGLPLPRLQAEENRTGVGQVARCDHCGAEM